MRRTIPREGTERYVWRFLWYPVQIGNDWRWMEKVRIRQIRNSKKQWETKAFADEELLDKLEGGPRPGEEISYE